MTRLVQVAWLLPALWLLLYAARVAIADLREHGTGREWADCRCLDCLDGNEAACEVSRAQPAGAGAVPLPGARDELPDRASRIRRAVPFLFSDLPVDGFCLRVGPPLQL